MAVSRSFAQRVNRVRRIRHKEYPIEAKAANSASKFAERNTELWDSLYAAKVLEYQLDKKISTLNDVVDSLRLNRTKKVLDT
jgi:hypothetical protein